MRPEWQRARDATRPKRYRDDVDSTVASSPSCAFCAALARHLDDGSGVPGRGVDSLRLSVCVDLEELARIHGECTCLCL